MPLGIKLPRGAARDPVVNGFTRLSHGVLSEAGPILGSAGPGSDSVTVLGLPGARAGSSGTVESVAAQIFDDLGANHALAGVVLAGLPNVALFHGTALVPSSAELWVGAVKVSQSAVTAGAKRFKLALESGRLRAWADGAAIYDGNPGGLPASVIAALYLATDHNPGHDHATTAQWTGSKATTGNALLFRRCPSGGSVTVNVNGGADQTVNLDVLGAGALDLAGSSQPVRARYRIYDAPAGTGTLLADLIVPYAYGGDVIGINAVPLTPAPAGAFTLVRRSSGLLFTDDFERADGPPGGNYVAEVGTWAIAGGKLVATIPNGGIGTALRCAAVPARLNLHVQADIAKQDLRMTLGFALRRNSPANSTMYQFDVGSSNDGTDPNKTRLYRRTANVFTRIAGGLASGIVVNVAQRLNFSTIGATQRGWVDGGQLTAAADATAANQIAGTLAFSTFGNAAASTVTVDNFRVCADRFVGVMRLPVGYKVRVGALVSPAATASGDVTLDLEGTALPAAAVEVLDAGGAVVQTLAPAGGVYGGDLYQCDG